MSYQKKTVNYLLIIALSLSSISCVKTHYLGEGVIIETKKINKIDLTPGNKTLTGAKIGGKTGVVSGAVLGGGIGLIAGAIASPVTETLLIGAATGGLIGGIIFGVTGIAIGGSIGYLGDLVSQNKPIYKFKVKEHYV